MLKAMDSTCLGFGAWESGLVAFRNACSKSDDIDAFNSRIQFFTLFLALYRKAPSPPIDAGITLLLCLAAAAMAQAQHRWKGCIFGGRSDPCVRALRVSAARANPRLQPGRACLLHDAS